MRNRLHGSPPAQDRRDFRAPKIRGRPSANRKATLALREMLVQGQFRPGERIREVPLAATLDVSRIPLHLALERLAHEGFLEVHPRRGFIVQRFSPDDIYDAIELRGLLEGAAARLATERLRDVKELTELQKIADEIVAAGSPHAAQQRWLPAIHRFECKVPRRSHRTLAQPHVAARHRARLHASFRLPKRFPQTANDLAGFARTLRDLAQTSIAGFWRQSRDAKACVRR